jgi:hypothetical protein
MRKFVFIALCSVAATAAFAQDLDTVSVADQFSAGSRTNQANGSAYSAPTYPDITGTINYSSTFEGGNPVESEVLNVTVQNVTDDPATIPAITGDTGDGASVSPNFAVFVGDGGGGQNLEFGELNDANYQVNAAVYCFPRQPIVSPDPDPLQGWERVYITIRCPQQPATAGSNPDAIGGYAINFETDNGLFQAVKWNPNQAGNLGAAAVRNRDATARTVLGQSATALTVPGWHKIGIKASGSTITFYVDGAQLTQVTDTTFTAGIATLSYREAFSDNANEYQGRFDYMTAGPAAAGVEDALLY